MPRRRDDDEENDLDDRPRRPKRQPKGSLLWLWVGLGIGGLFLVALVGAGAVGLVILSRAPQAAEQKADANNLPAAGLIAHWTFDDINGPRVPDKSGQGNDATLVGATVVPGAKGQAVAFAGVPGERVELGKSKTLNFGAGAAFTFAGWVRTADPAGVVLSCRNSTNERCQIDLVVRQGQLMAIVGDDTDPGSNNAFVGSGGLVADGQWHHWAFTRTGAEVELFIDGISKGRKSGRSSGGPITTDLRAIGAERLWEAANDRRWGPFTFRGAVDDVRVYDRTLTAGEVRQLAKQ
jgi:hypothetical protein